jgi:hypothetical protein
MTKRTVKHGHLVEFLHGDVDGVFDGANLKFRLGSNVDQNMAWIPDFRKFSGRKSFVPAS